MRQHGILPCEAQRYSVEGLMLSQADSSLMVSMMQIHRGHLTIPPVPLTWAARVPAGRRWMKPSGWLLEQVPVPVFPPGNAPDYFVLKPFFPSRGGTNYRQHWRQGVAHPSFHVLQGLHLLLLGQSPL